MQSVHVLGAESNNPRTYHDDIGWLQMVRCSINRLDVLQPILLSPSNALLLHVNGPDCSMYAVA